MPSPFFGTGLTGQIKTKAFTKAYKAAIRSGLEPEIRSAVRAYLANPKLYRRGWGLASAIGELSYQSRTLPGRPYNTLTKYEHKRKPPVHPLTKAPVKVDIPTVSQRRTKDYSENKMLSKSMAKKSTTKKSTKKRYNKKRRIPLGIPRSKAVRLRLATQGTLTATTGTLASTMLKANSLNDPTGALSAYLPHLVDQYAALYQKYIVLGSIIKIKAVPTTNTGGGIIGVHLADNNTALTNVNHYKMLPRTKQLILTTQKDYGTITLKYSGKKFWKLTNIRDDSEQEAVFSTTPGDPTDIAYYHIYANDLNGSHTFTVEFQVEMEFIILLTDPVQVAESAL